jgi:hypothetical protein
LLCIDSENIRSSASSVTLMQRGFCIVVLLF